MRKVLTWIIIGMMLVTFPGIAEPGYEVLTQKEARIIIYFRHGFMLVDVREEDDYDEGHIPGAISIPEEEIGDRASEELPDRDQLILIYGCDDAQSQVAATALVKLGYTQVVYFGGFDVWEGLILSTEMEDDPFEAWEYGDPEDFYFDYYDEFDDYDEAEEYFYEHCGC